MADLDSVVKTPFISVFDMLGKVLASTNVYGEISVVSLRYKYDDEDDDICTIKLQMVNPTALDILNIKRGTKLQVVWGYLGGPIGPLVVVVVRDMTSKYGTNIIYTELECTDYLTFIKIVRSNDVGEGTFINYIKAQIYGKYNIVIKDRGKVVYAQVKGKKLEGEDRFVKTMVPTYMEVFPDIMFDPIDILFIETVVDPAPEGSKTIKTLKPTLEGTWFVKEDHPIYRFLNETKGILTANRSTFVVIQDLFRKCPRGPWFVTGRGETLFIHNRDLGKNIYKQYKYKDELGHLIDFTPKTKFENFDKQVVSYAGMDPKNRVNLFIDDYRKALYNQRNPKEILKDRVISDRKKAIELKKYFALRNQAYPRHGIEVTEGAILFPGTEKQWFLPGHFDKPFRLREPQPHLAAKDHTGIANVDPWVRKEGDGFDPLFHDPILRAVWYTMPLESYSDAVSVTNNRLREIAMDKEEAKIILEGDPLIISEFTIRITNVHSQHEGQYYIKKCEHILTHQGYKTQLDCIKVVPEAILTTLGNISKDEYDNLDDIAKEVFDKQYKKEQELFGPEVKISYQVEKPVVGISQSATYTKLVKENETQGYTNDDDIGKLIELSKLPDSYITFDPENK